MFRKNLNKVVSVITVIISFILVSASLIALVFRQTVLDQLTVWSYEPSSSVEAISERNKLTSYGKFIFYASQPEVDAANIFNSVCNRIEKTTTILGCYTNSRIYVYDVTDSQLDGVKEVTSAHEMLHAIYERMSPNEKSQVNALLEEEYAKLENDKSFSDLMSFYARTEPGERDNELHSIIGTQIRDIGNDLEKYYSKYFVDRGAIVSFYESYNGIFKSLAERATEISSQLDILSDLITKESDAYNAAVQSLNSDIVSFNQRANNNQFSTQEQFNAERNTLLGRVAQLTVDKQKIDEDIVSYNSLLEEYNAIAIQSTKLYNSIDSTLVTAPSV